MTTYAIHYTDPLRDGFTIAPGGFNGPGGSSNASNLRLYGRGALEWGEAVDENLLRIAENLNGATPPPYAVGGQLWLQTRFYWRDTNGPVTYWYRMDPNTPGIWQSAPLNFLVNGGAGSTGTTTAPPASVGAYWYTANTGPFTPATDAFGQAIKPNTLYRYDSMFQQVPVGWLERVHMESTAAPVNGTDYPSRTLLIWDEFTEEWVSPPISIVSSTAPTNATEGAFWWNPTTDQLFVWDGSAWTGVILASGTVPMSGNLNMGTIYRITNLAPGVAGTDAVNVNQLNTATSLANLISILTGTYVRLDTSNPQLAADLLLNPNGPYPQPNTNIAATHTYVNSAIASLGLTPGTNVAAVFTTLASFSAGAKQGAIAVDGVRAWIRITSFPLTITSGPVNFGVGNGSDADWKQIFPALYS